ncbi:hypothetical protein Bhyg_02646 [Pseudolycoriella hygida]|uniref:Pacifastin domain-containing protein n=1 Tax=Pseudolycoriella hygida TaxID=35572 RepID=A0A9Q0S6U7_9DIPT|nr:hypothetical protein Bhyg_02646 [Pseudolycoriella hygida]
MKCFALLFLVLCLVSMIKADEEPRRCVDGKTYNDGCNNCFCSNGHVACTLMLCWDSNRQPVPRKEPPADFYEP